MREIRLSGSEGGGAELNQPSLPLSKPPGWAAMLALALPQFLSALNARRLRREPCGILVAIGSASPGGACFSFFFTFRMARIGVLMETGAAG